MGGRICIGVSGWRYTPWRGHFYPRGLAQSRELEYASRQFPSLELNGSFYSLQRPESYARWAADISELSQLTVSVLPKLPDGAIWATVRSSMNMNSRYGLIDSLIS